MHDTASICAQKTAKRLIDKHGTCITLRTTGTPQYDTVTGQQSAAKTDANMRAVIEYYSQRDIQSAPSIIAIGDVKVTIAGLGNQTPKVGDFVVFSGSEMAVMSVQTEFSGGLSILHFLQCRKVA